MRRLTIRLLLLLLSIGILFSTALAQNTTTLSTYTDNSFSVVKENTHDPRWSATKDNPFPLKVNTSVAICFSPGGQCTQHVVDTIEQAKHSIRLQAFAFTSRPIANALVAAYQRGINVTVILDKSNPCETRHRPATCGKNYRISNGAKTMLKLHP